MLKGISMMMRGHDNLSVNDQMEDLRERMRLLQGDRKVGNNGYDGGLQRSLYQHCHAVEEVVLHRRAFLANYLIACTNSSTLHECTSADKTCLSATSRTAAQVEH